MMMISRTVSDILAGHSWRQRREQLVQEEGYQGAEVAHASRCAPFSTGCRAASGSAAGARAALARLGAVCVHTRAAREKEHATRSVRRSCVPFGGDAAVAGQRPPV